MNTLKNYFFPAHPTTIVLEGEVNQTVLQGRGRILTSALRFGAPFSLFALLSVMNNLISNGRWAVIFFYVCLTVGIVCINYISQSRYYTRTILTLSILYMVGTLDLLFFGVAEDWRLYYAALIMLTTLFLGRKAGFITLFICVISFIIIAWLISTGAIVISLSIIASSPLGREDILIVSVIFAFMSGIVIMAQSAVLEELETAWQRERSTARQLSIQAADIEDVLNRERLLANQLEHSLVQQEELNRLRSRIITTVSHEFRTPLAVINTSSELLIRHSAKLTDQKREENYQRIRRSIFYLTDLLQDISWVDKSNSSQNKPHLIRIAFNALCESLVERLHREAGYPANLTSKYSADDATILHVDPELIKQVVFNLVTNALKYSPLQTPVSIKFECQKFLHITVKDQGIGIPSEELEHIGELFYRGKNVETYSGLGLGLFNVQKIVSSMDGTVRVTSPGTNQGTIFQVQIPCELAGKAEPVEAITRRAMRV